jgi:hypothetical protein
LLGAGTRYAACAAYRPLRTIPVADR